MNRREREEAAAAEQKSVMVREAFAVLAQGVELMHYNTLYGSRGNQLVKQLVWMDADLLRICIDSMRPTLVDKAIGKVAPGLYLRDISEVREGIDSLDFLLSPTPPRDKDRCMSLVGSERSLSLEMPSKFARDWFMERLRIVVADVLTEEERRSRAHSQGLGLAEYMSMGELEAADHLIVILQRGMHVLCHHPSGAILKSVLTFDSQQRALVLKPSERGLFGLGPSKPPIVTTIADISEVRCGCHSLGFVRTGSLTKFAESFSIISSGTVMDITLASTAARDILVDKLRSLLKKYRNSPSLFSEYSVSGGSKTAIDSQTNPGHEDFNFDREGQLRTKTAAAPAMGGMGMTMGGNGTVGQPNSRVAKRGLPGAAPPNPNQSPNPPPIISGSLATNPPKPPAVSGGGKSNFNSFR